MDFVYHLVRILRKRIDIKISYIEFIQQVKTSLFSCFDEIKSIKDVLFQYNYCILIYYNLYIVSNSKNSDAMHAVRAIFSQPKV
jgi:hypothetical protein